MKHAAVADPFIREIGEVCGRQAFRGRIFARRIVERLVALREIGTGAKGASGPGDDHRAHVIICVGKIEGGDQLLTHPAGEGVQLVGPMQAREGDPVGDVTADRFKARFKVHGEYLTCLQ